MPRPKSAQPAYQFHINGQARITLGGKVTHGTIRCWRSTTPTVVNYRSNRNVLRKSRSVFATSPLTSDFRARVLPRYAHDNGQHNRFSNLCGLLDERRGDESPNDLCVTGDPPG